MSISWMFSVPNVPRRALLGHRGLGRGLGGLASCAFSSSDSTRKDLSCQEIISWAPLFRWKIHCQSSSAPEESALEDDISRDQVDPFSMVESESSLIANRLRQMVHSEVPELSSAAEYFFGSGAEGKKIRLTVSLLMAKSLELRMPDPPLRVAQSSTTEVSERQRHMAGITEFIHVASLIHDDVLDDANTRRGVGSLNFLKGNKLAILTGDFVLSRAFKALASLMNPEVITLLATSVDNLIRGETMQYTASSEKIYSMEFYMEKTYNKAASLIANSCQAIAVLSHQTPEVANLAFKYGKNLGIQFQLVDDVLDFIGTPATLGKPSLSDIKHGIITAPVLFAMEEFPELRKILGRGVSDLTNLNKVLECLWRSNGIQRTRELAMKHSELAEAAIQSLPETMDCDIIRAREALVNLSKMGLTREK